MVTVLDLQCGNIGSVVNMLRRLDVECSVANCSGQLAHADRIIIPGVGGFNPAVLKLNKTIDMRARLMELAQDSRIPLMGICLGMQLLFDESEEGEGVGLGLIEGKVKKLKPCGQKIPHMGWNKIQINKSDPLFRGVDTSSKFYFVHSFAAEPSNNTEILATTEYGQPFCSIVRKQNIYGVQFHPEKSHKFGMQLLKNFCEIPNAA